MELIDLVPMVEATKHTVAACLEAAAAATGVPLAIIDDHGADLHGGVEIFRAAHPGVIECYDIKHKAACLLKALLEHDPLWKALRGGRGGGQMRPAADGVGGAGAAEPAVEVPLHEPGRVGGLGRGDAGGAGRPGAAGPGGDRGGAGARPSSAGWRTTASALAEWSAWHDLIGTTLEAVRDRGLYAGAGADLAAALPAAAGRAGELREPVDRVRHRGVDEGAPAASGCRARRKCWSRSSAN